MSSSPRKSYQPESHLIERDLADRPARTWDGHVRLSDGNHSVEVMGTWHLDLPDAPRAMKADPRAAMPLPETDDLEQWHKLLLRLLRLQQPGMQLRVLSADEDGWQQLEYAAPTSPPSVVHLDRHGLARVLGQDQRIALSINARSGR